MKREGKKLSRGFTAYDGNSFLYQRWKGCIIVKIWSNTERAILGRNFEVTIGRPASETWLTFLARLLYDWRFTANQFVLAPNLLWTTTSLFFYIGYSPCETYSLTRGWVCLLWICLPLSQVYVSQIYVIKNSSLYNTYMYVLCQSRLCKAKHTYLIQLMLQRQLSHLSGRKLDRRPV
jgi:hypothetical protein